MKKLNCLERGLRPYTSLCALAVLLLELSGNACFAGVIYEYRESDSTAVIATMEILSLPASASSAWSTAEEAHLIALFLDNAVFGLGSGNLLSTGATAGFSGMSSSDGARLDGGSLPITFPTILGDPTIDQTLSLLFAAPGGEDFIGLATVTTFSSGEVVIGDLFIFGDWVAQATAVVPEPETYAMLLAGLGLLVFFARRRTGISSLQTTFRVST